MKSFFKRLKESSEPPEFSIPALLLLCLAFYLLIVLLSMILANPIASILIGLAILLVFLFPKHIYPAIKQSESYLTWRHSREMKKLKSLNSREISYINEHSEYIINKTQSRNYSELQQRSRSFEVLEQFIEDELSEVNHQMNQVLLSAEMAFNRREFLTGNCPFCQRLIKYKPERWRSPTFCTNPDCSREVMMPCVDDVVESQIGK
jgi:hypothetical protein